MHSNLRLITRFIAVSLFSCAAFLPLQAQGQSDHSITFPQNINIPEISSPLPVFLLVPQPVPTSFLRETFPEEFSQGTSNLQWLGNDPLFQGKPLEIPHQLVGLSQKGRLLWFANIETGDSEVFPSLATLEPSNNPPIREMENNARNLRQNFIAPDSTQIRIGPALILRGVTINFETEGPPGLRGRGVYLVYVPYHRYVDHYPVVGIGSRAALIFDSRGRIKGLIKYWKKAKNVGRTVRPLLPDEVRKGILRQLQPIANEYDITITKVEVVYYDGNLDYLQPCYRFLAIIQKRSKYAQRNTEQPARDFVLGYLPMGTPVEPLPSLLPASRKVLPTKPKIDNSVPGANSPPGDPTVGRYVIRHDVAVWTADANGFWRGILQSFSSSSNNAFTDKQYYWAYPELFTSRAKSFVDNVNIGLVEAHGDWWRFATYQADHGLVDFTKDKPRLPYGSAPNGNLCFLVFHSCKVVPTSEDTLGWQEPWHGVFGGLHAILGYRTAMYIDDGVGFEFGMKIGKGAPVIASWISSILGAQIYSQHAGYTNNPSTNEPLGRASSVVQCYHEDDSAFNIKRLSPPKCLKAFWQSN